MTLHQITSAPRPGRAFEPKAELALDAALIQTAMSIMRVVSGRPILLPQLHLERGVPDMVLAIVDETRFERRRESGLRALRNVQESALIERCGRGATEQSIAGHMGVGVNQTKRLLKGLSRDGLVEESAAGIWRAHPAVSPFCRTYALEAKVSDWRAGIGQCFRYLSSTNATVLVMGELSPTVMSTFKSTLAETPIGAVVGNKWTRRPQSRKLPLARLLATSERVLSAIYGSQEPSA